MADSTSLPGEVTRFRRVDLESLRAHRGWFFALGIGLMVLGAIAIFSPFVASLVTTVVLGWLMIVGGLFQVFHAIQNRHWGSWGWELVSGVLAVIAGALVVRFPLTGTITLTLILAIWFALEGILKIVRGIQHRWMPRWGWLVFDGVLALFLGVLILARWPSTAAWALGVLVGVDLLFGGSSMLMIGVAAGPSHRAPPRPAHAV